MKKLLFNFLLLTFSFNVISQELIEQNLSPQSLNHEKCGFDQIHKDRLANDPVYLQKYLENEAMKRSFVMPKVSATYVIPVVVHVMSDGTQLTAITDQQIKDAIRNLNERMRKVTGGLGDGNGVDVSIEYALAVRDPNGNCTNGIVRVDMTGNSTYMNSGVRRGSSGITDAALKAISVWDQTKYYNIWLVSEIDNSNGGYGTLGYAYFSSSHGTSLDGAVMVVSTVKDPTGTTLIHELGHSLDLYHTFEGDDGNGDGVSDQCPTDVTCGTSGDCVSDTPRHRRSTSGCVSDATANACQGGTTAGDYQHNYMDYSSDACQNMFTDGQKTRMLAAVSVTRASFLAANGNMALVPVSSPTADFTIAKSVTCSIGESVKFYDLSSCTPNSFMSETSWSGISFSWSFTNNAGTTYTSTNQNPIITFAVAGTYDATLTVTTSQGSSTITKQGILIVGTTNATSSCIPTVTAVDNYGQTVRYVTLNTISEGYSPFTNKGYQDYRCTKSTVLAQGGVYPISIEASTQGGSSEFIEVYVSWNGDADFVDANETILTGSVSANTYGTVSGNLTVPAGALLNTPLLMRVIGKSGSAPTSNQKNCTNTYSIADVKDYIIYISDKVASVSIASSDPDNSITFGTSVTFTATPTNGGTTPTYKWYKNGTLVAGETNSTYTTTTLLNGDQVYCKMTSNLAGVIASPAQSNTISTAVTGPPQSDFTVNRTSGCTSTSFNFSDASALAPTSWSWTFTGGTPSSSTAQNPSVTYASPGTYAVTLTASNGNGTGTTMTKTGYITIYANPTSAGPNPNSTSIGNFGHTISNVTFNTINNSTSTLTNVAYTNNICSQQTTVYSGLTYQLSVTLNAGPNATGSITHVYLDYNNNGSIDAGEQLMNQSIGINSSQTFTTNVTIPLTATLNTLLRLRVIGERNAASNPINPNELAGTENYEIGDVEDYGVIIKTTNITAGFCGTTISNNLGTQITCTPISGATHYRFEVTKPNTTVEVITRTTPYFHIYNIPGYTWNTPYSVRVAASANGTDFGSYGSSCTVTSPTCLSTQLTTCGQVLPNTTTPIVANTIGTPYYRFRINGGGLTNFILTKTSRWFYLNELPSYGQNVVYTVEVAGSIDNVTYCSWGSPCTVTTPSSIPTTQVQLSQRNQVLPSTATAIVADNVVALKYRFRINGGTLSNVLVTSNSRWFYLNQLPSFALNQTYSVEVAVSTNGTTFGAYGTAYNITTPGTVASTQVQASQCNQTLSFTSSAIIANNVWTKWYRFRVNGLGVTNQVITKSDRWFTFADVTGEVLGQTYTVEVTTSTDGVTYSAYGTACAVTLPLSGLAQPDTEMEITELNNFTLETYPNPNDGNFTISSSHEGTFNIVNELGQLVRQLVITKENGYTERIENMSKGVYFVTGTINSEVITKKVIVQ